MLRVIESGGSVKMVMTLEPSFGVDTVEDLKKVEQRMSSDSLLDQYR